MKTIRQLRIEFRTAKVASDKARMQAAKAFEKAYQPGGYIWFKKGRMTDPTQAKIKMISTYGDDFRLKILNLDTGKEYWIRYYDLYKNKPASVDNADSE